MKNGNEVGVKDESKHLPLHATTDHADSKPHKNLHLKVTGFTF